MINLKKLQRFEKVRVGIQIGNTSLKIVVLKKFQKGKQWEITDTITEKLAEGIVAEGKILLPEILGFKIKETLLEHAINVKKVSVFIEELPFFVRRVHIPKVPKREINNTIFYKSQIEFPVPIDELLLHHTHLGRQLVEDRLQEEYIVIAVYRSNVEKAVQAIHQAGLAIDTFGLEPEAMYRGLKFKNLIQQPLQGPLLLVRRDSNRFMLTIYADDKLVYSRYTPIVLEGERENAEEITRTIFSWNGKHTNDIIQSVVLVGEEHEWQATVEEIKRFMPILSLNIVSSPFTACLGIALDIDPEENLNIEIADNGSKNSKTEKLMFKGLVVAVLIVISVFLFFVNHEMQLEKEIKQLTSTIHASSELATLIETRKQLLTDLRGLEALPIMAEQTHVDIVPYMTEINSLQPVTLKLSEVAFTYDSMNLQGKADSQADVVLFLERLQMDVFFSSVQLVHSSESQEGISFTLNLQLTSSS